VSQPHSTFQHFDVPVPKNIPDQTVFFAQVQSPLITSDYASGILTAVLKNSQGIIQIRKHMIFTDNADQSTQIKLSLIRLRLVN